MASGIVGAGHAAAFLKIRGTSGTYAQFLQSARRSRMHPKTSACGLISSGSVASVIVPGVFVMPPSSSPCHGLRDPCDTGVALCVVAGPAFTEQHCHRPWPARRCTSAAGGEDIGCLQLSQLHCTPQLRRSVGRGSTALGSRRAASTATAIPRRRRMSQTTVDLRLTCAALLQLQPQPEFGTVELNGPYKRFKTVKLCFYLGVEVCI